MKVTVIVVNFHSKEKIEKLKEKISSSVFRVIVIDNDTINRGFARGANEGIQIALKGKCSHILLVNPDLQISSKDINKLTASSYDIASPVLKFQRKGKWIHDLGGKVRWLLGRTYHFETTDYRLQTTVDQIDYVSGACMLIKHEVLEKIGLFDEQFFMYFEDVDFCLRAKTAGFSVGAEPHIVVEHQIAEHRFGNNLVKKKYLVKSNLQFINKWVPWYYKPTAYVYWLWLVVKS